MTFLLKLLFYAFLIWMAWQVLKFAINVILSQNQSKKDEKMKLLDVDEKIWEESDDDFYLPLEKQPRKQRRRKKG